MKYGNISNLTYNIQTIKSQTQLDIAKHPNYSIPNLNFHINQNRSRLFPIKLILYSCATLPAASTRCVPGIITVCFNFQFQPKPFPGIPFSAFIHLRSWPEGARQTNCSRPHPLPINIHIWPIIWLSEEISSPGKLTWVVPALDSR